MTAPALAASIEGVGLWTPHAPSWEAYRALLEGRPVDAASRPAPALLPANERRRAPDTVLVALEAAQAACADAGRDPSTLPSVFVSTYGDLAITENLCQTLATAPLDLSPTRFHNSVHNAAAGYWTIGTGAMAPATAISAGFAMGLLEAMAQLACGAGAVLLVGYDGSAPGLLRQVAPTEGLLGGALVLATPMPGRPRMSLSLVDGDAPPAPHGVAAGNAMAPMLALFEALARGGGVAQLPAGPGQVLRVELGRG
ncbi:beta-ketoacyl synthase chain length factor [Pseudoxanthomonas sp. 10H]|uniref:beta-ketoacyl synthase chain length factor n=1 Tax=Pseudoxanthomonas sp. 10H TaxID=3242729 RepID=UPI003555CDD6